MKFIYTTLDKNSEWVTHWYEEKHNPDEIQYMLETLNIHYTKHESKEDGYKTIKQNDKCNNHH